LLRFVNIVHSAWPSSGQLALLLQCCDEGAVSTQKRVHVAESHPSSASPVSQRGLPIGLLFAACSLALYFDAGPWQHRRPVQMQKQLVLGSKLLYTGVGFQAADFTTTGFLPVQRFSECICSCIRRDQASNTIQLYVSILGQDETWFLPADQLMDLTRFTKAAYRLRPTSITIGPFVNFVESSGFTKYTAETIVKELQAAGSDDGTSPEKRICIWGMTGGCQTAV
jgi:hypothetical protein